MPKVKKPRTKSVQKTEPEHFDYHLEIELNDVVHKVDTNDLHQALVDFTDSPSFPPLIKTGAVFKYSKGDVHREKVMFNANEARREFYNKVSLELLAKTMTKELG